MYRLKQMENEELELDLDQIETNSENKLKVKNRFQTLSDKVKQTSQERDELNAKLKAEADAKSKIEKERDFFRDFSQISTKYPQAAQHQDKILEKVGKGYSPKAATLEVLEEAGQLLQPTPVTNQEPPKPTNVAGGSASNVIVDTTKSLGEMSKDEKRDLLLQLEKEEGFNILRQ